MSRARIGSVLMLLVMLVIGIPLVNSSNSTATANTPIEAVSCKIDRVTGSVAHIVCVDILGNVLPPGLNVSLPSLPEQTVTLPPIVTTETVEIPGPTVTIPGPTETVTIAAPTVTLPPLPNATITLPGVTLPPITLPGPTSTVTIIPGSTLTPRATRTVTVETTKTASPITKTETVTASPSPAPTVTATVTATPRQEPDQGDTIESGPTIIRPQDLTTIEQVGLGFLAILAIAGLIIGGMWSGYYLGFKESDAKEANFLKALLGR